MPSVFWTGELSPPTALLVNASNTLAFITELLLSPLPLHRAAVAVAAHGRSFYREAIEADKRATWVETHASPAEAYRFFSGTGGTWWLSKFSDPETREALSQKVRDYFERNRITRITQDVVLAYGVRRSGT